MLHPKNYRNFTSKHLKTILNHDDNIPPEDLSLYIEKFDLAKRYYLKEELANKGAVRASRSKKSIFGIAIGITSKSAVDRKGNSAFGKEYWNGNLSIEEPTQRYTLDQSL